MGTRVDNREFVVTWTRSLSVEEVAQTLGMSKRGAMVRAKKLRDAGVKLKKFPRRRDPLTSFDVAQLNDLINKTEKA